MLSVQTNGIMYLKTKSQDTLLFVITVTVNSLWYVFLRIPQTIELI